MRNVASLILPPLTLPLVFSWVPLFPKHGWSHLCPIPVRLTLAGILPDTFLHLCSTLPVFSFSPSVFCTPHYFCWHCVFKLLHLCHFYSLHPHWHSVLLYISPLIDSQEDNTLKMNSAFVVLFLGIDTYWWSIIVTSPSALCLWSYYNSVHPPSLSAFIPPPP